MNHAADDVHHHGVTTQPARASAGVGAEAGAPQSPAHSSHGIIRHTCIAAVARLGRTLRTRMLRNSMRPPSPSMLPTSRLFVSKSKVVLLAPAMPCPWRIKLIPEGSRSSALPRATFPEGRVTCTVVEA
jgi:hypothetical protein